MGMEGELNRGLHIARAKLGTKYTQIVTLTDELHDDHATNKTLLDELVSTLNELISETRRDQVVYSASAGDGAGLSVDGVNPENIETDNVVVIQKNGLRYKCAAVAELDISAAGTCAGDTIAQNAHGVMWAFLNTAGSLDVETPKTPQDYSSQIEALAAYATATNTLPPGTDDVCIGAVHIQEDNSGAFTLGTDDPAGETAVNYYSFEGLPGIESAMASFALDASAATFTYGAVNLRLGTGARVAATGKANVTISGSNVADGAVGAWLFYVLADDTEIAVQLGAAYADLSTAQDAVRDHNPNPLMPLVGVIYVENDSGSDFVPGTTNLDATGITATFTTVGPGSNHLEIGRAQLGQPHQVLQNASAATLTASKIDDLE